MFVFKSLHGLVPRCMTELIRPFAFSCSMCESENQRWKSIQWQDRSCGIVCPCTSDSLKPLLSLNRILKLTTTVWHLTLC